MIAYILASRPLSFRYFEIYKSILVFVRMSFSFVAFAISQYYEGEVAVVTFRDASDSLQEGPLRVSSRMYF